MATKKKTSTKRTRNERSVKNAKVHAFGRKIATARKVRGWTQAQLAAKLGVGQPAVCDYERGMRTRVTEKFAASVKKVLGIAT